MKLVILSDEEVWASLGTGGFGYRYQALLEALAGAGHQLHLIYLDRDGASGSDRQPVGTREDVRAVRVYGKAGTRRQRFKRDMLDLVAPRRTLAHDRYLEGLIEDVGPDVVIMLVAANPEIVRNTSHRYPTILFAEEDFSRSWDVMSANPGMTSQFRVGATRAIVRRAWPRPDAVIVISDTERAWVQKVYPAARTATMPLFVDETFWFARQGPLDTSVDIFAIGEYNDARNAIGMRRFLDALASGSGPGTPKVHLASRHAVHPVLRNVEDDRLEVLGYVRDPRSFYETARLCVVPSLSVSGAKNQVLQGWACGCPVVASWQAAASVQAVNDVDVLSGRDARALAECANRALRDDELRDRLRLGGMTSYLKRHSKAAILADFERELAAVVSARSKL